MTSNDIRAWRKRLGLSQSRAAQRLGLGLRTLQYYEAGREVPRVVELSCAAVEHGLDRR